VTLDRSFTKRKECFRLGPLPPRHASPSLDFSLFKRRYHRCVDLRRCCHARAARDSLQNCLQREGQFALLHTIHHRMGKRGLSTSGVVIIRGKGISRGIERRAIVCSRGTAYNPGALGHHTCGQRRAPGSLQLAFEGRIGAIRAAEVDFPFAQRPPAISPNPYTFVQWEIWTKTV